MTPMHEWRTEDTDRLFKAIVSLKSVEECYDFFDDACTVQEIMDIAQRLKVAKMLCDGEGYNEIREGTGVSTTTISRVNRSLKYGCKGYQTVLERIREEEPK